MMNLQNMYALSIVLTVFVGFVCAKKLSHDRPFWVRIITLSPALTGLYTLAAIARSEYVAYVPDMLHSISMLFLYALVASRFTENPWLDIRVRGK